MILFLFFVLVFAAIGLFVFRDMEDAITGLFIGAVAGGFLSAIIWLIGDWTDDVVVDKGPVVQKSGNWAQKVETDWRDAEKTLFFTPEGTEIALSDDITIVGGQDTAEYFYVCQKPTEVPLALRWNFWKDLEEVDCDNPHVILHTSGDVK